ncbi:hypothetical protein [Paenibacillus aceris]|uniref:Alpha/beta hydrolase n=1 Tax=Paenibacillus aceris TaxID=869555 RepID=A0ABS4HSP8_9BACL|nr:hypothetical protein [Paenibacillus aceris]MBP1961645.1 hypothetical protein [Paenibacillus aceris]NHW34491.1 hypothetical protein [Paenibacillus aceris]
MTVHSATEDIVIYITAGFATAPDFLDRFGAALAACFEQAGVSVRVVIHFPYGDWSRQRQKQLREITSDLWNNAHQKPSRYGGKNLTKLITDDLSSGQKLLLIGHSAGAVASIQAAGALMKEGVPILGVIQIGSPRCAIPPELRSRVLYLDGTNQLDQKTDPIPRLGTWGGWIKSRFGVSRWHRMKHAPIHRKTLPIIGGHADYFRDHKPYIWQDATNLQTTIQTIWTWLAQLEEFVELVKLEGHITEKEDEHD